MEEMNEELIQIFLELSELYELLDDPHRARAYLRAASDLQSGRKPSGRSINAKVLEYANTGRIKELEQLRQHPEVAPRRELGRIVGVGPATVKKWLGLNIRSVADLRREVLAGRVKLNKAQEYGLRYYDDLNARIPRTEVEKISSLILSHVRKLSPDILAEVAGSYRRGATDSRDIDILTTRKGRFDKTLLRRVLDELRRDPNFIEALAVGEERLTFLYRSPFSGRVRQIDILHIKHSSYAAALLYFTGSWIFNETMRGYAKSRGYRLNQAGLYRVDKNGNLKLIPTDSEEKIFELLGLRYIPPAARGARYLGPGTKHMMEN